MGHTGKREGLPRALGVGLAILGISLPVFAVDGVIEINQAAVNAAGGFPFVIGAPGSYRLTGNLTVPAETTAIQIAASQVTLDLNGFAILGPLSGTNGIGVETPLSGPTFEDVTVRNGAIRGMASHGILLREQGGRVENVRAFLNGGTGISVAQRSAVHGCTAVQNDIGIEAGSGSTVSDNVASDNAAEGILVVASTTVSGNTARGNLHGIEAGSGSMVRGNIANSNTILGITAVNALAVENAASFNGSFGLQISGGYGANVFIGNNGGSGNPQVSGGSELGSNFCGSNTVCP